MTSSPGAWKYGNVQFAVLFQQSRFLAQGCPSVPEFVADVVSVAIVHEVSETDPLASGWFAVAGTR
jgi:hypothetical protein